MAVITGGSLFYLYVDQQQTFAPKSTDVPAQVASASSQQRSVVRQQPASELAQSAAPKLDPVREGVPFDLPSPMQPLSAPAPRHLSPAADKAQDAAPATAAVRTEPLNTERLRIESLDLQQRLETFSSQWRQAYNKASEKHLLGQLPELEAEERVIDQRFADMYAAQLADSSATQKARLLQALPNVESHQAYDRAQNLQQLMDIQRDFTELRTMYVRNVLAAPGLGEAPK